MLRAGFQVASPPPRCRPFSVDRPACGILLPDSTWGAGGCHELGAPLALRRGDHYVCGSATRDATFGPVIRTRQRTINPLSGWQGWNWTRPGRRSAVTSRLFAAMSERLVT